MKKLIILIGLVFGGVFVNAETLKSEKIELQVGRVIPTKPLGGYPRTPVAKLDVSIDGNTMYLNNVEYDLTLVLVNTDGNTIEYTYYVPSGTTTVTLPSTLSGTYELRLIPEGSSFYFYGYVTL